MSAPRKEQLSDDVALWLGDCREVLPMVSRIDAVVTDPPFGIDYRSGHATPDLWKSDRIACDLDVRARDEVVLALRSTRGIPMLVFGSWKAPKPAGTRAILIWDKGPALGMGALDIPWKPSHEEIYVIGKGWLGTRDEGAVLYCPPVQSMACNGRVHPNQKPEALLSRLIKKCPMGIIFDPFMGSGSTGVSAIEQGRGFVGVEIETPYFDIACRRISEALKRPRLPFEEPKKVVQESFQL